MKTGFTLIEILIAIAIIGLLSLLVLPNLRKFNQEQVLKQAAATFTQTLQKAKNNAQTKVKCSDGRTSSSWSVYIPSSSAYELRAQCLDGSTVYSDPTAISVSLAGVSIEFMTNSNPPSFSGGVTCFAATPFFPITIDYSSINNTVVFTAPNAPCVSPTSQPQVVTLLLYQTGSSPVTITATRGGAIDASSP